MDKADEGSNSLLAQAEVWNYIFSFADSMALKCAVELRIPDIIHSKGRPLTILEIASNLASPSPDLGFLSRILRFLVRKNVFSSTNIDSDTRDTLYGLTEVSRWLLHDSEMSLGPMLLMQNHPYLHAPWHYLSRGVREGGVPFKKAHGQEVWDFAATHPEFNQVFYPAMECSSKIIMDAILGGKKISWEGLNSLVDVGGGMGTAVAAIVKANPHIQGINFDLPHVVATAPVYDGVCHVGGDMFNAIPQADAIFMKWILHDWGDEDCVKILRKCRRAIGEKKGRIFIAEVVLNPNGNGIFDGVGMVLDLLMMACCSGGKERSESEWKKLLEQGGFPRYHILHIAACISIIEAYPE